MDLVTKLWHRATALQPAPSSQWMGLLAVAALLLVVTGASWRWVRLLVTILHEGGHALVAVLCGRRLRGIRLHGDTSGLTVSSGRARGPGMVLTLAAGYVTPALAGLGAVLMLDAGRSLALLWVLLLVLALMLLQIRNGYGFAVLVVGGAVVSVAGWYAPAHVLSTTAYLVTWLLLWAAPKPLLELASQRARGQGWRSDPDQLAKLTGVSASLWIALFLLLNGAALVAGAVLLLPGAGDWLLGLARALGGTG